MTAIMTQFNPLPLHHAATAAHAPFDDNTVEQSVLRDPVCESVGPHDLIESIQTEARMSCHVFEPP